MASGATLTIDDKTVLEAIDYLAARVTDMTPVTSSIAAYLVTSTQRRIERETGPNGAAWQRLSPRTAERRIKGRPRGYDHMLRVSGRLYGSITPFSDARSAEAGTNVVYAALQHGGGEVQHFARSQPVYRHLGKDGQVDWKFRSRARSNFQTWATIGEHSVTIPARPYFGFDAADQAEVTAIINDHVVEGGL